MLHFTFYFQSCFFINFNFLVKRKKINKLNYKQKKVVSGTLFLFFPANRRFPTVPTTQYLNIAKIKINLVIIFREMTYPGMRTIFFSEPAHFLNTSKDVPACNIPGVANNTIAPGSSAICLSKGNIFLKSNIFLD